MSNVVRTAAQEGVIHEVKNIKRAFCSYEKVIFFWKINFTCLNESLNVSLKGMAILTTEGINIDAMLALETYLDINKLFCNNIHDMAKYYGIEAANRAIVKEVTDVFQVK